MKEEKTREYYNKKSLGKRVRVLPKNIFGTVRNVSEDEFEVELDNGKLEKFNIFDIRY